MKAYQPQPWSHIKTLKLENSKGNLYYKRIPTQALATLENIEAGETPESLIFMIAYYSGAGQTLKHLSRENSWKLLFFMKKYQPQHWLHFKLLKLEMNLGAIL